VSQSVARSQLVVSFVNLVTRCVIADTQRTCLAVGPTYFTPPHQTRQNSPVCVVSARRGGVNYCYIRAQIANFLSATVFSCRESNSHRRSGRDTDTDKTVLSFLAWRCELALMMRRRIVALKFPLQNCRPSLCLIFLMLSLVWVKI